MNGADELELYRTLTRLVQQVRASDSWIKHTEAYEHAAAYVAVKRLEEMFPSAFEDG